jgi:hypothetical protein
VISAPSTPPAKYDEGMMLTPKKHLNLHISVVRVTAIMLRELNRKSVIDFEKLRAVVIRRVGADGELSFMPALSFVYLLGRVEYHDKNDTIE